MLSSSDKIRSPLGGMPFGLSDTLHFPRQLLEAEGAFRSFELPAGAGYGNGPLGDEWIGNVQDPLGAVPAQLDWQTATI